MVKLPSETIMGRQDRGQPNKIWSDNVTEEIRTNIIYGTGQEVVDDVCNGRSCRRRLTGIVIPVAVRND